MKTPRVGQIVEFHSNHPDLPPGGAVVRGKVNYVGSIAYPSNPCVWTPQGGVELLARWWGNEVKVICDA